jgi:hypothetical protein
LAGVKFPPPSIGADKAAKFLKDTFKKVFPDSLRLDLGAIDETTAGAIVANLEILRTIAEGNLPDGAAVSADQLTGEQRREFLILDNLPFGAWNFEVLANEWDLAELSDWGLSIPGVTFGTGEDEPEPDPSEQTDPGRETEPSVKWVPDCLFESNNEFDVPTLRMDLQGVQVLNPVAPYGYSARDARNIGTYHFYVDDYRFTAIWDNPNDLIKAGVGVVIEPNLSLYDNTPLSYGLFLIYKKRWIARYWQSFGVRVFVDLNVSHKFSQHNLLGVPQGWNAYATRGYSDRLELLEKEFLLAQEHSGRPDPLFVVYGGGKAVKGWTNAHNLIYCEQIMAAKFAKNG